MAFTPVNDGDLAIAPQVQQILDALSGVAGAGQAISLTSLESASEHALAVQNLGAGGLALHVYSSTGADLLDVRDAYTDVDNGTLRVSHSTNRVGINNTNPAVALDVTGSASISGALVTGTLTMGGQLLLDDGSTSAPSLANTGDTNTGLNFTSTADKLQLVSGGTSVLDIDKGAANAWLRSRRLDGANAGVIQALIGDYGTENAYDASPIYGERWSEADSASNGSAVEGYHGASKGVGGSLRGGTFTAKAWNPWTPGVSVTQIIGVLGASSSEVAGAGVWAANLFATAENGATAVGLCGIEVDIGGVTGTTVAYRYGVQVVSNASQVVAGSGDDVGFRIAAKNSTALFKHGILFDTGGGYWPISATGTLFATRGAGDAGHGIDFSATTFATDSIYVPGFRVATVSSSPKTIISNDASQTPAARLHVKDSSSTLTLITQADNSTRFNGQVQVRGNTNSNLRLYFGVETSTKFGLVQALENNVGIMPLALQPTGGVTTLGDFVGVAVSPDTAVLAHLIGTGSSMVALAFDQVKTSTSATAGAQTLPSNPVGFLSVKIDGTERKIPYYAT